MPGLLALKLALLTLVACVAGQFTLHDVRHAPPAGFTHAGAAPADQAITLRVGLASSNMAGLEAKLQSISHPGSAEYGKWLNADELKAYVQPSSSAVAAFQAFAEANKIATTTVSPAGEWIEFTTTIEHANTIFAAKYQTYTHAATSAALTRTLAYSLPDALVGHVDTVLPTTSFDTSDMRIAPIPVEPHASNVPISCNTTITPKCLELLYQFPSTPARDKKNTMVVTGYLDQYAQQADLSSFLARERPDMSPNTTFKVVSLDNGTDPQSLAQAGTEADLDIEYTIGIATGVPVTFLTNGNDDFVQGVLDATTYLAGLASPPSVMTTSYGGNEDSFSRSDAQKICAGYMALGARGISVLYSSGDGGVRGGKDEASQCTNNTFIPVFPASCPYVTAVGSTIGISPERATNFTSGGFSNYFSRPWYQDHAVGSFLKTVPASFPGVFNRSGRGFPDVATQGWHFEVYVGGKLRTVGGTSASTPTFASIIAIVNDRLGALGRPSLGYLNPFLYLSAAPAGVFNDVISGKNPGLTCNDTAVAFSAQAGWDPATGFGTPNYPKLLAAAGIKSSF